MTVVAERRRACESTIAARPPSFAEALDAAAIFDFRRLPNNRLATPALLATLPPSAPRRARRDSPLLPYSRDWLPLRRRVLS